MRRFLSVGPNNTTGFRKHLEETAYCYEGPANFLPITTRGDEQLQEILEYEPDFTLIGGRNWIKRNSHILERIPGKKGLLIAGPLGQNEISGIEITNSVHFLDMLDAGQIDYIFLGCKQLTTLLNRPDIIYLPAPLKTDLQNNYNKTFPTVDRLAILNDNAPHKNTLNSFAGVALSDASELVVNGISAEYARLATVIGLDPILQNVGKLPKDEYLNTIDISKLLLHVSYSEGLCYGVQESMIRGTPVLVSNAMPWFSHPMLLVDNPADHAEIADKINHILRLDEKSYVNLGHECHEIAAKKAQENNKIVSCALDTLLC